MVSGWPCGAAVAGMVPRKPTNCAASSARSPCCRTHPGSLLQRIRARARPGPVAISTTASGAVGKASPPKGTPEICRRKMSVRENDEGHGIPQVLEVSGWFPQIKEILLLILRKELRSPSLSEDTGGSLRRSRHGGTVPSSPTASGRGAMRLHKAASTPSKARPARSLLGEDSSLTVVASGKAAGECEH